MASSSSPCYSPAALSSSKPSGGSSDDADRGKIPAQSQPWEWKSVKAQRNPGEELGFCSGVSGYSPGKSPPARSWEETDEEKKEAANSSSPMALKLGKRTYEEQKASSPAAAGTPPPSTTPAKKGRGCSQTSVTPKCQVEGCQADLSGSKDYHRRHKVCEVHSKTPKNTVNGQEQRFCQQCSRFHLLPEFDEGKRSCRRRLQGHNERRRKPQPDALAAYNMGNASFQAAYQRLGVGSSIIVDSHSDHALGYGPSAWGRLGRDQFLSKQLVENLSPEKLLLLLQNSKRPTGLPTISSSSTTTAAAITASNSSSMAKPDQMKLSLSSSSGGGGGVGGLSPVLDSGRALSLLSSDAWTKSPTSYELSPGSSAPTAIGTQNSQYILTSAGSDGGSPSPKAQAHQQSQQAHQVHHHHHRHHHSFQSQSQDAIPMPSSGNSSSKQHQHHQQQQQQQQQQKFSSLGMNRF